MQKVIEGWVGMQETNDELLHDMELTADDLVYDDRNTCVHGQGDARKVRVTIIVEEIDKEGGA